MNEQVGLLLHAAVSNRVAGPVVAEINRLWERSLTVTDWRRAAAGRASAAATQSHVRGSRLLDPDVSDAEASTLVTSANRQQALIERVTPQMLARCRLLFSIDTFEQRRRDGTLTLEQAAVFALSAFALDFPEPAARLTTADLARVIDAQRRGAPHGPAGAKTTIAMWPARHWLCAVAGLITEHGASEASLRREYRRWRRAKK